MIRNLTLLILFLIYSSQTLADELERSRIDLEAKKKVSISNAMILSDEQSADFWDIYSDYERDSGKLTRESFELIREYSDGYKDNTLTEQDASKLIDAYFVIEKQKLDLKKSYLARFSVILPAKKVFRFYQIDNKIDSLIRCDIAKKLPLIEPDMEF